MIKAVFFDAAGTLFHLPRGVGYHYRIVAERRHCHIPEGCWRAAFGAAWQAMPAREAGRSPRPDDDRGWWRDLVGRVLAHCQITRFQLDPDAYFNELYAEFIQPGVWELFPEVRQLLETLRPRFRLAIISNFDGRLRPILANLGVDQYFEHIVISSEVGADKPDAWIFGRALDLMGVSAEEAIHAGDDPRRDWNGATAAGLHHFPLQRPANALCAILPMLDALASGAATSPSAS